MKTVPNLGVAIICEEHGMPPMEEESGQAALHQEWFDPVFYYIDRVLVLLAAALLLLTILAQTWIRFNR